MAATVEKEAIRSHPASLSPLVTAAAVGQMERINPVFRITNPLDLGQGIVQIGAASMQALQP